MVHVLDVAPSKYAVPSEWAMVCVVGAPEGSHRARGHVRLPSGAFASIELPVALVPLTTRIQIEIETAWPAVLTLADVAVACDAGAPLTFVAPDGLHVFNGNRVDATGGLHVLCITGTLVVQISGIEPSAFGPGARLCLTLRCDPVVPLSVGDPVLAGFAHPERALRAGIAALDLRARALRP